MRSIRRRWPPGHMPAEAGWPASPEGRWSLGAGPQAEETGPGVRAFPEKPGGCAARPSGRTPGNRHWVPVERFRGWGFTPKVPCPRPALYRERRPWNIDFRTTRTEDDPENRADPRPKTRRPPAGEGSRSLTIGKRYAARRPRSLNAALVWRATWWSWHSATHPCGFRPRAKGSGPAAERERRPPHF